jgi:hypothetical protein
MNKLKFSCFADFLRGFLKPDGFLKIRQQKGLGLAWSKGLEFFCYTDVQEFHPWFAWRFLSLSLRRKASCTKLPAFFIRFASSEHCVQSMYPEQESFLLTIITL